MSPITSAVRCLEQLCEPSFFRRVAAMSGYSTGSPRTVFGTYQRHGKQDIRRVECLLRRGLRSADVAEKTGIKLGTICKWRQRLVAEGKLQPMRMT